MRHGLVFFYSPTCGMSRRMDSVVDHFLRSHRAQLRVAKVDVDERPDLAERFSVTTAPSLLLLDGMTELARIEGRSTLPRMKDSFGPLLAAATGDAQPDGGAGRTESSRELASA